MAIHVVKYDYEYILWLFVLSSVPKSRDCVARLCILIILDKVFSFVLHRICHILWTF